MNTYTKFFRVLMQIVLSAFIFIHQGMAQRDTLFTESFESAAVGQTPPTGWAVDPISGSNYIWFVSAGTMPACTPFDGNRMVEFRGYNNGNNLQNRLKQTIPISTMGYNVVSIDIRLYLDTNPSSQWDEIDLQWSPDGINWTNFAEYYSSGPTNQWVYEGLVYIPGAGQQPTVYISFLFKTIDPISMNCHLDLVHVYGEYVNLATVTTGSATNIDQNHATVHGIINPNGSSHYWGFEYGRASDPYLGNSIGGDFVDGTSDIPISVVIPDLLPGVSYRYRAYATGGATVYGADSTFTTSSKPDSTWFYMGARWASPMCLDYSGMIFDQTGHPCVLTINGQDSVNIMRFDGSSWSFREPHGFYLSSNNFSASYAFSPSWEPYVTYSDHTHGDKATVKRSTGTTWVNVGSPGFSASEIFENSIAFGPDGLPYVGYRDYGSNPLGISVKKFDGTYWNNIGGTSVTNSPIFVFGGIKFSPSGQLYTAYGYEAASVRKFDGSNWVLVGDDGFSVETAHSLSFAFSRSGEIYVAFMGDSAYVGQSNRFKLSVMKFDGTKWSLVGKHAFARGFITTNSLAISPQGEPYLSFQDADYESYGSVMKFNGVRWVYVGNRGFTQGYSDWPSLVFSPDSIPFVNYNESDLWDPERGSVMYHPTDTASCNHADFIAYPDSANPFTFHFIDQSYGDVGSWYWNFGDGNTSTDRNPVHTYTTGYIPYHVCLEVDSPDGRCSDVHCDNVMPGAVGCQAIFAQYPDTLHQYGVQFEDHSVWGVIQWNWDFGDGTTSVLKNPNHIYPHAGNYHVCLTIHTSPQYACSTTTCRDIHVWNTVHCTNYFTYVVNGFQADFFGHMTDNRPASYSWDFGDGQTGQGSSIQHLYTGLGTFNVSLTTIDSSGCTFTSSQPVEITDSTGFHQVYGQIFAGIFPINSGLVLIFSIDTVPPYTPYVNFSTTDTNGVYYFTTVPDGDYYIYAIPYSPAEYLPTFYGDVLYWEHATIIHLGHPVNPYNIHLIHTHSFVSGNGSIHGTISVTGLKSTMVDNIMMLLADSAGNRISYYDVDNQGGFGFQYLAYGTYFLKAEIAGVTSDEIRVVLSAGKPDATVSMTFSGTSILGTDNSKAGITAIMIYPNPVGDNVNISLKTLGPMTLTFEIINMTGEVVQSMQKRLETGSNTITLPAGSLKSGIYSLRISSDEGFRLTKKLVKLN